MALEILKGPFLNKRTTLRLGGQALAELVLKSEDDFDELPDILRKLGGIPLVLGLGSNILAKEGNLPLVIINPAFAKTPAIIKHGDNFDIISVDSSTPMPSLLNFCVKHGLSGLEGLAGIPGTVGGAIAMNAGSYGDEIGERLQTVTAYIQDEGLSSLGTHELNTSYRSFNFKNKPKLPYYVIKDATLKLTKKNPVCIKENIAANIKRKTTTQPITAFSAGCAFCNPAPDVSAGKLLDECGFKGKTLGGMMFSPLHANFLVNSGTGTSYEALVLLDQAKQAVYDRFGYNLQLEIKVYP